MAKGYCADRLKPGNTAGGGHALWDQGDIADVQRALRTQSRYSHAIHHHLQQAVVLGVGLQGYLGFFTFGIIPDQNDAVVLVVEIGDRGGIAFGDLVSKHDFVAVKAASDDIVLTNCDLIVTAAAVQKILIVNVLDAICVGIIDNARQRVIAPSAKQAVFAHSAI